MQQTKPEDGNDLECMETRLQKPWATSQDDVEEIFPKLSPRPIFLLGAHVNSKEGKSLISEGDNRQLLPPRKEFTCPWQGYIENEAVKKK